MNGLTLFIQKILRFYMEIEKETEELNEYMKFMLMEKFLIGVSSETSYYLRENI